MAKRNGLPSFKALPLIGVLVLVIQLVYWGNDPLRIGASIVASFVSTLVPVSIIFGAILFNRFIEVSGAIHVIKRWLANITPNPTAQLMIIGWAFAFMIEGASGFGTPAAIAAPLLVSLGFRALPVAILALVMNSVPVSFGAVGTPTWYGFSPLADSGINFVEVGAKTAWIHAVASLIIPLLALRFVVSWSEIKKNIVFIYISILSCVVPYFFLAQLNDEFPSLIGGAIGLVLSAFFASKGVGISKDFDEKQIALSGTVETYEKEPLSHVVKALFPFAVLIGILVVTRIQQLPLKAWLNSSEPLFGFSLGFADFKVSKSITFGLYNIFGTGISDSYKLLYVPALIPFVVTVLFAGFIYKTDLGKVHNIFSTSFKAVKLTYVALFGAFVMVKLMMLTSPAVAETGKAAVESMVKTIGTVFAGAFGNYWLYVASYLGAIGAFFSGSNTVSNLTFGSIQQSIAVQTGLNVSTVLALQSVGGAMGNMVCLNNIIAVCTVTRVENQEGYIIKKTAVPMFIYGVLAAIVVAVAGALVPGYWA